jgi:hypothetical protein
MISEPTSSSASIGCGGEDHQVRLSVCGGFEAAASARIRSTGGNQLREAKCLDRPLSSEKP